MDFDFITKTFVRLLAALPLTLSVWFLSVVLGALIAAGVTWMRVSGVKPLNGSRAPMSWSFAARRS